MDAIPEHDCLDTMMEEANIQRMVEHPRNLEYIESVLARIPQTQLQEFVQKISQHHQQPVSSDASSPPDLVTEHALATDSAVMEGIEVQLQQEGNSDPQPSTYHRSQRRRRRRTRLDNLASPAIQADDITSEVGGNPVLPCTEQPSVIHTVHTSRTPATTLQPIPSSSHTLQPCSTTAPPMLLTVSPTPAATVPYSTGPAASMYQGPCRPPPLHQSRTFIPLVHPSETTSQTVHPRASPTAPVLPSTSPNKPSFLQPNSPTSNRIHSNRDHESNPAGEDSNDTTSNYNSSSINNNDTHSGNDNNHLDDPDTILTEADTGTPVLPAQLPKGYQSQTSAPASSHLLPTPTPVRDYHSLLVSNYHKGLYAAIEASPTHFATKENPAIKNIVPKDGASLDRLFTALT